MVSERELVIKALRALAASNRAEAGSPQGYRYGMRLDYVREAVAADALAGKLEGDQRYTV